MRLESRALQELLPDNYHDYVIELSYSGKFRSYNANVRMRGRHIKVSMSRKWEEVSEEIQVGLIQSLLVRLLKVRVTTTSMDIYDIFMRKVHIAVPKSKAEPLLEESFERVNALHFNGMVDKPNLAWGNDSLRKLGSYEYGTDTIVMSTVFRELPAELLDYVMHHEMLHKHLKFYSKNGKSFHHTHAFRMRERAYPDSARLEKELQHEITRKRRKVLWGF
ncbi:TPA: M48 family metallopeptidase [Candidatus Woesearchaeota archaeon]|nr:M48 family metallopeptidase [Candidatus Woesearchaeota archaeon]HII68476.1 M48 family metallopeptidase [Candidatus Woesearchaeota archaeon]